MYFKWATRPSSVVREPPIAFYLTRMGLRRFLSIPIDKEKSDYYLDQESYHQALKKIMKEIILDPLENIKQYGYYSTILIEKAKTVYEHLNDKPNVLWKLYDNYIQFMTEFSLYMIGTFSIEELLIPSLEKKFPKEITIIYSPGKLFEYQTMRRALFEKPIAQVQKEYGWMNLYNYCEEDYPITYFEDIRKTITPRQVKEMIAAVEKNEHDFKEFLAGIKNKKTKTDCILVHEYSFIKTDRVDSWKKSMQYIREFFRNVANKSGFSIQEVTHFTHEELKEALLNGRFPAKEEIKLRTEKKCIIEIIDTTVRIITNPKEIQKIKESVKESGLNVQELKGKTACKGLARGRVSVITDKTELHKMKKGNILVAIWTIPDYFPAMQNAAGIITEEGGMTSHAAVISRELHKPCLLNVKNATQLLKDGDFVEVDAEKGIVRKIKESGIRKIMR